MLADWHMVSSYGVKGLRAHSGDLGSALSLTTHTTVGKKKKKKKIITLKNTCIAILSDL